MKSYMRLLVLLMVGTVASVLLLTNIYPWLDKFYGGDRDKLSVQLDAARSVVASSAISGESLSLNFETVYKSLMRVQNESLFHVDKKTIMPLMRLTDAELNQELRVRLGKQWMKQQTVVFAGVARNAKDHLPNNVENIHRLGKLFKDYWMVFVENDSKDGTRQYLQSVRQQFSQTVILGCEPANSKADCHLGIAYRSGQKHRPGWAQKRSAEELEDRSAVMCALRNIYLNYIYTQLADKASLMIVIEPDISWHKWNLDSIAQGMYYFGSRPGLDLLCANGRLWGKIYDPCSRTYFSKAHFRVPDGDKKQLAEITDTAALEQNKLPVKVDSCFQAFAIYRISSLAADRLHYGTVPGEWNCEHNSLARQLKESYIDPAMWLNIYSLVVHSRDKP